MIAWRRASDNRREANPQPPINVEAVLSLGENYLDAMMLA